MRILRAALRLHDAADHATILRVDIGPDRTEGDPFLLDERAVVGRRGDDRLVATLSSGAGPERDRDRYPRASRSS